MRKTITWVLLAAMLLSAVALAIPVGAAVGDAENIHYVNALLFTQPPTIDGYISRAEWGVETFTVESSNAATINDDAPKNNSFFYWRPGVGAQDKPMSYQVWLRWDENYFYVGVKVNDTDGHSLKGGKGNTWNGDALQMIIDYQGPNSIVDGFTFDPSYSPTGEPWLYPNLVPDFLVGYVQIVGGFTEMYENTNKIGMTAYNSPAKGAALVAVAPAGLDYSTDTANNITTYEVAIPWNYIFYQEAGAVTLDATKTVGEDTWGGIDRELGMSMVLFNAEQNSTGYTHALAWGSGILNPQVDEGYGTCGGSNCVTLVADEITPANYEFYDPANLERFDRDLSGIDQGIYYDYLAGDTARQNPLTSKDQLTALTYDEDPDADLDIWGGTAAGMVVDSGDPEHGKVLDYTDPNLGQTYIDSRGEGEGNEHRFPLSFTMEFDIMVTGTHAGNADDGTDKYSPAIFNWFGGSTGYDYEIGYYFSDSQFKIIPSESRDMPTTAIATADFNWELNTWYNWRFVYDNNSCTARLYINDQPIFDENTWNRYFYYSSEDHLDNGTMMLWRMFNTTLQMDNVRIYNAAGPAPEDVPEPGPGNGNGGGTGGTTPTTGGGDLDITGLYKDENGFFRLPVHVKADYKLATTLNFTLSMNPEAGSLDSISGLNEGTYTLEDQGNGVYFLEITDFQQVRSLDVGALFFEFVIKPTSDSIEAADLELHPSDYFYYLPATGDAMLYIALAAIVMAVGCVVVYKKRRSFAK